MLEGTQSTAALDWSLRLQPSVARSSGESELGNVGFVIRDLVSAEVTKDEIRLVEASSDAIKTAASVLPRLVYPIQELIAFISQSNSRIALDVKELALDASVAESVSTSGSSKALGILKKTMSVDLLCLRDQIRYLGLTVRHVPSADNKADLFTKPVSGKVMLLLKAAIGRTKRFLQGR